MQRITNSFSKSGYPIYNIADKLDRMQLAIITTTR